MSRVEPTRAAIDAHDHRPSVICLGAGGHAKVVIDVARAAGYTVSGLLDADVGLHGAEVAGIGVWGGDDLLQQLYDQGFRKAVVGVGTGPRRALYRRLGDVGFEVVSIVHPTATVSPSARRGAGLAVMPGAVVNADASIGDNTIVNTRAVVEHDCVVGDHVHIACGAQLAGGAIVGEGTLVGAGATVLPGVSIGANSLIGAGAVVVHDVPATVVVAGNPARIHLRGDVAN